MPDAGLTFSVIGANNITFLSLNQFELEMDTILLAAELSLTSLRGQVPLRTYGKQAPFLAWAALKLSVPSTLPPRPLPFGNILCPSILLGPLSQGS